MEHQRTDVPRKAYLAARLNLEKCERTTGHLARFLARRSIALRLLGIAVEQRLIETFRNPDARPDAASLHADEIAPFPHEVREALRELRMWKEAASRAYARLTPAERETVPALLVHMRDRTNRVPLPVPCRSDGRLRVHAGAMSTAARGQSL